MAGGGRVEVLEIGGTHFFCQSVGHCSMGVLRETGFWVVVGG
jgi:hypothetical protein